MRTLVCPVNCVGVMSAGLAKEFKEQWPRILLDYQKLCYDGKLAIGCPFLWFDIFDKRFHSILLFVTKMHYKEKSKLYYSEDSACTRQAASQDKP